VTEQRDADEREDQELREVREMAQEAVVLTERALTRHRRILAAIERTEELIRETRRRRPKPSVG
jgi:hypothetical protein